MSAPPVRLASSAVARFEDIIAIGNKMAKRRFQNPTIKRRANGTYYIRPWMPVINPDGSTGRKQQIIDLPGAKNLVEAKRLRKQVMDQVNTPGVVLLSQMMFSDLLDVYDAKHIETQLGAATRVKYRTHIQSHIRPAFSDKTLSEITPLLIQTFLDGKKEAGLAWATRMDTRNVLSGIFERATFWGYWPQDKRNPVQGVKVGRKQSVYEHREWTIEESRQLLFSLPPDVQILCITAWLTTLRISELLGLQEKHFDAAKRVLRVEQRFYREDIDQPKTEGSRREIPLDQWLVDALQALCLGDPDRYLFCVRTRPGWGKKEAICRSDSSIRRYFLRPAAEKLGLYTKGFGFHDLRREAITDYEDKIGLAQTAIVAGHAKPGMTGKYVKKDSSRIREAMRQRTETLFGTSTGPVQ